MSILVHYSTTVVYQGAVGGHDQHNAVANLGYLPVEQEEILKEFRGRAIVWVAGVEKFFLSQWDSARVARGL